MTDAECVAFLQWALPRLRLRWPGFRKVRRQVCRRIEGRLGELHLAGVAEYRGYLLTAPAEWTHLDGLCHITISRFYRDRGVFDFLGGTVLPELVREGRERAALELWSAGCASGEEPYTLSLVWQLAAGAAFPGVALQILATDADATMLRRARTAEYPESALRDLPEAWREEGFTQHGDLYRLRARFRQPVTLRRHDVREAPPSGPFDLVLCRNLAFTYFDLELQRDVAARFAASVRPEGALVIGRRETLPDGSVGWTPWSRQLGVFRRLRG